MANFFLDESLRVADCAPGALVTVGGSEGRHAVTVSRIRPGEQLLLGNGAGLVLQGSVEAAHPDQFTLRVTTANVIAVARPRIRLVQALAKGDRDELAVQAATELGIDAVIPWAAARSVARWEGAKIAKGRERWLRIVREATKQSIRPWLPEVAELTGTQALAALAGRTRMLLLEPTATTRLTEIPAPTDDRDILLVVGPEGGIAPAERKALESAGATSVRLGETVLRTSTAGPAALAILNQTLGRW